MFLEQKTVFDSILFVFVFLFGISIGSFLNVCIYRMGREMSIVRPSSHCPQCKKPIPWYDNVPLVSYLVLRGRCRACGAKFSVRYFAVELIMGLLFLAIFRRFWFTPQAFVYAIFTCGLVIATFVDFDFRIIPDEVTLGGIGVGLLLSFIFPSIYHTASHVASLRSSALGVLVGGGVLWILGCVGDFVFKKESMGGGDVKLLAMIGAFLGWSTALMVLPVASCLGAIVGIIIKLRTKESVIAFGPYLSMGALICMFFGGAILHWFFGLS
ncbi:MAG: prepilin peptidase [Candidatus Omnitrophota bacterium]